MSRFSEPQHPDFQAINASLAFDRRLWPHDVAQSRAHAAMLASIGVIGEAERDELLAGLDAVAAELAAVTIDAGIYDRVRAFRAPNSRHPKTGLHINPDFMPIPLGTSIPT